MISRLSAENIVMMIDKGRDFPSDLQALLENYGKEMWHFRENPERLTTRAVNRYFGDHRGYFKIGYLGAKFD